MTVKLDEATKKYYAVFSYRDETGALKWRKKRGFLRKRDARDWEHDESKRIAEEIAKKKSTLPTFREVAELRMDHAGVADSTRHHKRVLLTAHFSQYLDTPVDRITRAELVAWRIEIAGGPYRTASKNLILSYVREVLSFASDTYGIPNAGTVLKLFSKTQEERNSEMQVWSIEEFNQFLSVVDNPLHRLFYEFAFWTGCRRGEICALRKANISGAGYATICESYGGARFGICATKNKRVRTIKLDPVLFDHLRPLLDEPGPYLFGGESPIAPMYFYDRLRQYADKAGVKRIRLHDFRHSHVSILYDNGVSTKAIAERIGDTEATVLSTYKHLMAKQEDKMNSVIESLHTA